MEWKRKSWLCLILLCITISFCKDILSTCSSKVNECPRTKETWEQRSEQFNCLHPAHNYSCLLSSGGDLIEVCIGGHIVRPGTVGCPYIIACTKDIPIPAHDDDFFPCSGHSEDCPRRGHDGYKLHELYKYPGCIKKDMVFEGNSTFSFDFTTPQTMTSVTTSSTGNDVLLRWILPLNIAFIIFIIFLNITYFVFKHFYDPITERLCGHRMSDSEEQMNMSNIEIEEICLIQTQTVYGLKRKLIDINENHTKHIPLDPSKPQEMMRVEQLYSKVKICERDVSSNQLNSREIKHPASIFSINSIPARFIILLGDACYGKTTFCIWLLKQWLNTQGHSNKSFSEWEKVLRSFDFVFYLNMEERSGDSLIAERCKDIHFATRCKKSKSLIFIDGLHSSRQLNVLQKFKIDGISEGKAQIICAMRPCIFESVAPFLGKRDRVIEIKGLEENGFKQVIYSVLPKNRHHDEYNAVSDRLEERTLRSLVKIPLFVVLLAQTMYNEKEGKCSLASYLEHLVNIIMNRGMQGSYGNDLVQMLNVKQRCSLYSSEDMSMLPIIFSPSLFLSKLEKLVYDVLLPPLKRFNPDNSIKQKIGHFDFKVALAMGLISIRTSLSGDVFAYFVYPSIQDYLAASYIVKDVGDSFCRKLTNFKTIMELSSVIKFICGMDPSLGHKISEHVVKVINDDSQICKYIEHPFQMHKVSQIYREQTQWIREMKTKGDSGIFGVSHVYLDNESSLEDIDMTKEILQETGDSLQSIFLHFVSAADSRIVSSNLNEFFLNVRLSNCELLYVTDLSSGITINTISAPSLKTLHLQQVSVHDIEVENANDYPVLTHTPMLQRLKLVDITLNGRAVGLISDMSRLSEVEFQRVFLTPDGWNRFFRSLLEIQNEFTVELIDTDIHDECLKMISSSIHLSVQRDDTRYVKFKRMSSGACCPESRDIVINSLHI